MIHIHHLASSLSESSNLSIGCGARSMHMHPSARHLTAARMRTRTTIRWGRWGGIKGQGLKQGQGQGGKEGQGQEEEEKDEDDNCFMLKSCNTNPSPLRGVPHATQTWHINSIHAEYTARAEYTQNTRHKPNKHRINDTRVRGFH